MVGTTSIGTMWRRGCKPMNRMRSQMPAEVKFFGGWKISLHDKKCSFSQPVTLKHYQMCDLDVENSVSCLLTPYVNGVQKFRSFRLGHAIRFYIENYGNNIAGVDSFEVVPTKEYNRSSYSTIFEPATYCTWEDRRQVNIDRTVASPSWKLVLLLMVVVVAYQT